MSDYLFTWKPDKWPHEKLKKLVDAVQSGQSVVEPWRCQSYRSIKPKDRAYLSVQGRKPPGIFGVAQISGPAELNPDRHAGEAA